MLIETRASAPFMKNGYVVACEATREAVVIDPGEEVSELLDVVAREALRPRYILLTHAHVDHVTGVGEAKRALGVPIYLHEADLFLYQRADQIGRMFGLTVDLPPPVDAYYDGSAPLAFGRLEARAHHTPGHCPGGVCLAIAPAGAAAHDLFVGDTLFAGSIGRTDLPGGDYPTLIRSIREVLFPFGDAARVYPGHGPETTIGEERRHNPFLA